MWCSELCRIDRLLLAELLCHLVRFCCFVVRIMSVLFGLLFVWSVWSHNTGNAQKEMHITYQISCLLLEVHYVAFFAQ